MPDAYSISFDRETQTRHRPDRATLSMTSP
jgi:hypothetical protein